MSSTIEKTPVKRRSKGTKTREKILVAAIKVLAINGIKGTTHRAIAQVADIQLSLTTYYFKDIQSLIHQAFQLNSLHILSRSDVASQQAFQLVKSVSKTDLRTVAIKELLCEQLTDMTANHLFEKMRLHDTSLIVEQLMFSATQVTPELKKLAHEHEQALVKPFILLCKHFNKIDPEIDAHIMLTVFSQLQYRQLALPPEEQNINLFQKKVRKIIAWIMGLKR